MIPIGKKRQKRKRRSKVDITLPERVPAKGHVWKSVAGRGKNGFTTSSHYLGVHWHRAAKKWVAQISINSARTHLGYFVTEEEAARKYDKRAKELGRPLNFPDEDDEELPTPIHPRINMEALDAQKAARENAQKARSVTPDLYVSPQSNLEASTPTPHFQQLCPRPKGSPAKENTELPTASIITYL